MGGLTNPRYLCNLVHMHNLGQVDALLTSAQAAALLNVSVWTVNRAAIAGDLPVAHKLHGKRGAYLFHAADVEAYAAQRIAS